MEWDGGRDEDHLLSLFNADYDIWAQCENKRAAAAKCIDAANGGKPQ